MSTLSLAEELYLSDIMMDGKTDIQAVIKLLLYHFCNLLLDVNLKKFCKIFEISPNIPYEFVIAEGESDRRMDMMN
jgi:hypothetical protein